MSPFETVLLVFAGVLAASALAIVYRMIVGPTILDRAIASDSLVTLVVMGMALYAAQSRADWAGPAMLSLTGLAFIGTVTFARFVAREDSQQGRGRRHPDEPSTDTGPHEAIHPDPTGAAGPDDVPENRFAESPTEEPWETADPLEDPDHPGEPEPAGQPAHVEDPDIDDPEHHDFGAGFGAGPGSRGFENEAGHRRAGEPTEGGR